MTTFISYGRDPNNPQHLELIEKIKKDLEKSGFKVLIDKENLRAGIDWEIKLESMVSESDWMLFFITPYSARRPDGYCLNELALALNYQKSIAPVMVDYIVPPLSICRIQYLNFLNFKSEEVYKKNLQEIISVLKGEKQIRFEGEHTTLLNLLDPLEFRSTIAKHIKGFVGREWVYDEIDNWLRNKESNILWITAEAGYGKTALCTYISQKHPACASIHYCQHDAMATQDPSQILRSFIYQLSTQIKEYHDRLLTIKIEDKFSKSPADIFRELIAEPLNNIHAPKNKLFFIIDALDEASNNEGKNQLVELIANRFGDLPPWFNILITSRPEAELLRKLKKFNPIELKTDDRKNLKDLKEYISKYFSCNLSEEMVQQLLSKSEGNILYLKMLLDENIDWNNISKDEINNLPVGMEGFYLQTFERRFEQDYYEDHILPYVSILISAEESIPVDILRYVLHINKREEKKIRDKLGSLIEEVDEKIGFYHKSLYDWLSDYDLSGEYSADVEEGDKQLVEKLWERYISDEESDLPKAYEGYLLKALYKVKDWDRLETVLKDILFIGELYNQHKQSLYKKILSKTLQENNKTDKETLSIYESFIREKEHLITKVDDELWRPKQTLFQLAYEDGNNSPLSQYTDKLIDNGKVDFNWLKNVNRPEQYSRSGLINVLEGHTESVGGALELQDGKILSWSRDKTLRIWSDKGEKLAVLKGHTERVNGALKLQDGRILSWSADQTLIIWSSDGEIISILEGHIDQIKCALELKDGRILSWTDKTLTIWDKYGVAISDLSGRFNTIKNVLELKDESILVCDDNSLVRYSAAEFPSILYNYVTDMILLTNDNLLTIAGYNLKILNDQGEELAILEGHSNFVNGALELQDGKILSWSRDKTLRIWSNKGEELAVLEGHTSLIEGAIELQDGKILTWREYFGNSENILWNIDKKIHKNTILNKLRKICSKKVSYRKIKRNLVSYFLKSMFCYYLAPKIQNILITNSFLGFPKSFYGCIELSNGKLLTWSNNILKIWDRISLKPVSFFKNNHKDFVFGIIELEDGKIISWGVHEIIIWYKNKNKIWQSIYIKSDRVIENILQLKNNKFKVYLEDKSFKIFNSYGEQLFKLENERVNHVDHEIFYNELVRDKFNQLWFIANEKFWICYKNDKNIIVLDKQPIIYEMINNHTRT